MITILEPKHYLPQSERQINDSSSLDLSKYDEVDSQHSSDDGMQVQIVNTEEIANQKVYKFCNRLLIGLITLLLVTYVIEMQKPLVVEIAGVKLIELPTIYTANIQNQTHEVAIFVPDQSVYHDELTEKVAQLCQEQQLKDCWKEMLFVKGYMFLQAEKWPLEHMQSDSILVFWQERLALSIVMLALNVQENQRIDILISKQHKRQYIEGLKINLNNYKLTKQVEFIYMQRIESSFLRKYGLVIGNHKIFDEIIYPQIMEQAVVSGFQQSIPSFIYQFIAKTHLLLFFDNQPSQITIEKLEMIQNQVINVSISLDGKEIIEENIKDFKKRFYVIALDDRTKPADQMKKKQQQIIIEQVPEDPQPVQAQIQYSSPIQVFETIQPIKYVPRIKPQKISRFFECKQNNRQYVKNGQFYETEYHSIKLIKQERESLYLKQSHFYNFVVNLLIASNPCNVLDIIQDEMLASIISSLQQGELFVPQDNNNLHMIKQTIQKNNLHVRPIQHFLGLNMLQNLVKGNLIKLSFVTMSFFQSMYDQLVSLMKNDMNIVMKMQGTQAQKKMLQSLMDKFYIFVVSQDKQKRYKAYCVSNYEVEYYEEKQYPEHSYLFISRQDVLFQDINFLNYHQQEQSRKFVQKKHSCLRNFSSVQADHGYNLKRGAKTITIDSKISIFMDGQTNLDQAISQIKQYEGISQFIKANLFVADSIAVVGDVIQSPYLLANMLQKVTGNGQIYFFNPSGAFQTYIEKIIQLNKWETVYEFMIFEYINKEFTTIIELKQFSVMMITVDALSNIYDIAQKIQGLLILLKFDGYSQKLVSTLKHFDEYEKYMINSIQSKKYKYNLCLNYEISNQKEKFFTKESFERGGWMAIVL